MHVVAVVQNKGGVGKTTLTRLLAEYFGREGGRILGLDLDPQCNFSRRFLTMDLDQTDPDGVMPPLHPGYDSAIDGTEWSGRSSSADIYFDGGVVPYPTRIESLDVLPGEGGKLRAIELVRQEEVKEQVHERLRAFSQLPEVQSAYDLLLIDTSPSKGPLTVSAVRAASHLMIPTTMEPQPIEGLYGMLQLWRRENRKRTDAERLEILGIQTNMFRMGVALHEGLLESLKNDEAVAPFLSPYRLGQRIAFAESDHPHAEPKSVFDLSPKDPARREAEAVCGYVAQQLFG